MQRLRAAAISHDAARVSFCRRFAAARDAFGTLQQRVCDATPRGVLSTAATVSVAAIHRKLAATRDETSGLSCGGPLRRVGRTSAEAPFARID